MSWGPSGLNLKSTGKEFSQQLGPNERIICTEPFGIEFGCSVVEHSHVWLDFNRT